MLNFEFGIGDWSADNGLWEVGIPTVGPDSNAHSGQNCVGTLLGGNYGSQVSNVNEALIVHSKTDKAIPIESARISHKEIPQSKLIELDNFGHYAILWSNKLKEIIHKELN